MIKRDIILVFDCGATNVRVIAINPQGNIIASRSFPNQTHEDPDYKGGIIWDLDEIWEKHGALATGENIEKAFDYLDVANKGAKMLLMAWSAGFEPTGLTLEEMKDLEKFI